VARRAAKAAAAAAKDDSAELLKMLKKKKSTVEEAKSAMESLRAGGLLGNAKQFSAAIVALEKGGKSDLAVEALAEMREQGLEPSAAAAAVEGGEHVAEAPAKAPAKPKKAKASSSSTAVDEYEVLYSKGALCTRFRAKAATPERLELAAKLLRSGGHLNETLSYTTALRNCEHGHHWEWALSFLGEMTGRKVEQDVVTYNVAIAACGRGQEWARSLALLEGMAAVGITPDAETYQASALACSRNNEWEQALGQLAAAQKLGLANSETYVNIAMMGCASAGAWEATLAMLEAVGSSAPKDVKRDALCYGVAMFACMKAKKWESCLSVLERMREEKVDPDAATYACAVQACRDGRCNSAANALIAEMRSRKMETNVGEILKDHTVAVDFPEVRSPVPLSALAPMAAKEVSLFKYVRQRATQGDIDSVIKTIEQFAEERSWLKIQGDDKRLLLEKNLRPTDRIVEFGCYVGYSSLVMARRLRQLGGQGSVTTCEVDAANAYIARGVIAFAGAEGEVQVRVGCASDWVATGQLGEIDVLLMDHRGTIYHDDLHATEPSLSPQARIFADNVLYPGAPLFLNYIDVQGYDIKIYELKEFKRPDLDDWVVICTPPKERKEMPRSTPPELRRLSAEVDAISWRSQQGPVDWVSFQQRIKPVFYAWRDAKGLVSTPAVP